MNAFPISSYMKEVLLLVLIMIGLLLSGISDTSASIADASVPDPINMDAPKALCKPDNPWVYDQNHSWYIEIGELLCAVNSYSDGKISIGHCLGVINLYVSHTEWDRLVYDENGDGEIDLGEFLCGINDYIGGIITLEQLILLPYWDYVNKASNLT